MENLTMTNNNGSIFGRMNNAIEARRDATYNLDFTNMDAYTRLKELTKEKVNPSKAKDVLGFAAYCTIALGSEVGQTVSQDDKGKTLRTHTAQFLNKNGSVNLVKVRTVLAHFGKKVEPGTRYTRVFRENVNLITTKDRFGRTITFANVSKNEVFTVISRIMSLDAANCTKDDLIDIAKDLDYIFRALGELSIDVAKDASKSFGVNGSSIIGSGKLKAKFYKNGSSSNVNAFRNKLAGKDIPEAYKIGVEVNRKSLSELPDDCTKDDAKFSYANDAISELDEYIAKGYEEVINNNILPNYKASNAEAYKKYTHYIKLANEDINIGKVMKVAVTGLTIVTESFGQSSEQRAKVVKDVRNMIYTAAIKAGMAPENVIKLTIAAAFTFQSYTGIFKSSEYGKVSALWSVMGKEFISEYCGVKFAPKLTITKQSADLCDGDVVEFTDGVGMFDAIFDDEETGEEVTETIIVKTREKFTGTAVVENGELVPQVNIYAYNEVEFTLVDKAFKFNQMEEIVELPEYIKYGEVMNSPMELAKLTKYLSGYKTIASDHLKVSYKLNGVVNHTLIGRVAYSNATKLGMPTSAICLNGGAYMIF